MELIPEEQSGEEGRRSWEVFFSCSKGGNSDQLAGANNQMGLPGSHMWGLRETPHTLALSGSCEHTNCSGSAEKGQVYVFCPQEPGMASCLCYRAQTTHSQWSTGKN